MSLIAFNSNLSLLLPRLHNFSISPLPSNRREGILPSYPFSRVLQVFHPYLISLHLPQILRVLYQVLMHLFTGHPRPVLPTRYRAFIYLKRNHNGLTRTPISQQHDNPCHPLNRIPKTVERSPCVRRKRLLTLMTYAPLVFSTRNTYIPTAN